MARIRYSLDENEQWDNDSHFSRGLSKLTSPSKPRKDKDKELSQPKTMNMDAVRKLIVQSKRNVE